MDCPRFKKRNLTKTVEAEGIGYRRSTAGGKWTSGGGIEGPCMYLFYGPKKGKTELKNKLKRSL